MKPSVVIQLPTAKRQTGRARRFEGPSGDGIKYFNEKTDQVDSPDRSKQSRAWPL